MNFFYQQFAQLFSILRNILTLLESIHSAQSGQFQKVNERFDQLEKLLRSLDISQEISEQLGKIVQLEQNTNSAVNEIATTETSNNALLEKLIALFPVTTPPAHFIIQITEGDETMVAKAAAKGKLKINFLDNGTAVATITSIVDAAGLPTTLSPGTPAPTWTSSDPGIVVTPAADGMGMSAVLSPATPPVLVSGATITATTTDAASGVVVTGTNDPADPVGVIAGGPTGFKIGVA